MPMPPYPPAQVTRVATYILVKGGLQADGTPSGSADWNNGAGLFSCGGGFGSGEGKVVYKLYLYENGSGTPTDPFDEADVPDLATATWLWNAQLFNNLDPIGPYFLSQGAPIVDVSIETQSDTATAVHTPGDPPGAYRPQNIGGGGDIPDFDGFDWKFAIGSFVGGGSGFMRCVNPPLSGEAGGIKFVSLQISGTATWLAWWWKLSEDANGDPRDACGNRQPDAPYIYSREDPSEATGYQWEKLDPNDHTAHPTPVIESIEPSHGRVQGGEPIIIRGSGFGTEATVTFDGVPALDVNVISQREIQVVDPPHLAGFVNVVVTNFDGVSS